MDGMCGHSSFLRPIVSWNMKRNWANTAGVITFVVFILVFSVYFPFSGEKPGEYFLELIAFVLVVLVAFGLVVFLVSVLLSLKFVFSYRKTEVELSGDNMLTFVFIPRLPWRKPEKVEIVSLATVNYIMVNPTQASLEGFLEFWDVDPQARFTDPRTIVHDNSLAHLKAAANGDPVFWSKRFRESLTAVLTGFYGHDRFAPHVDLRTWQNAIYVPNYPPQHR